MIEKHKQDIKKPEAVESPTVPDKVPANHYDQRYVEAYVQNPKAGKKQALLDAGYCGDYATQEACRIHKRVQHLIDIKVNETKHNLASLAVKQLEDILSKDVETVGFAAMSNAIKQGLDYSGHKPSDKVIIENKTQSIEEIDAELEQLERESMLMKPDTNKHELLQSLLQRDIYDSYILSGLAFRAWCKENHTSVLYVPVEPWIA